MHLLLLMAADQHLHWYWRDCISNFSIDEYHYKIMLQSAVLIFFSCNRSSSKVLQCRLICISARIHIWKPATSSWCDIAPVQNIADHHGWFHHLTRNYWKLQSSLQCSSKLEHVSEHLPRCSVYIHDPAKIFLTSKFSYNFIFSNTTHQNKIGTVNR
jgi:hypothetical protein